MYNLSLAKPRASASAKEDASLVKAARRDPAAFATLYRRYVTPIYRYLYSRVGNGADAEDLTAQVFTEALEGLHRYRERGNFAAWLFTIARHKVTDHYRRQRPHVPLNEALDSPADGADPLTHVVQEETLRRLAALVARLDEKQQELLRLRFAADLTYGEVHVIGARLVEEQMRLRDGPARRTLLEFDIDPVPDQESRTLHGIGLDGEAAGFRGGSTGGYNYLSNILRAGLEVREGETVPTGVVEVRVRSASVTIHGPWTITWALPGADDASEARVAPVELHPADANQTQDGLTVRVDEVVLTDRLTAVSVDLDDPPPGVTLSRILSWNPATRRHELTLEDDRGRRYELSWDVYWQPPGEPEFDAGTLTFQPVQPLARRLTLHAPAVEVTLPGTAAFDITVPGGLTMTPGGPDSPWLASASWDVDVPLEIAGYRLHFTEARLEDLNGTTLLTLTSTPFKPQLRDLWLFGLRLASVTAPDGRAVDLGTAHSGAGPEEEGSTAHRATLAFDVLDPETRTVQPGRYHVELDGVTIAVQEPWKLTWRLGGQ